MKKFGILVVAFIVAASVTVVMARPQGKGMAGFDGRGGKGGFYERLDLTEEQSEQIKALHESLKAEIDPIREAMAEKRGELKELWKAETPDEGAIKAVQGEMDELRSQISEKVTDNRLAVHEILTPEQREKMNEMKNSGGKGGKKGGRPPRGAEKDAEGATI